jgi:YidC/Oxa1 family membrane protein insertase
MPIFIAYFRMLSSAVELRHQPFFGWIHDLSMPDTITHVWNTPINLLPVLMAATSYVQFAMMPKTGDKNQRTMFLMFPLMFLYFCYTYASALALYWTWSNIISIVQTYVLNRRPVPPLKKLGKRKTTWIERLHQQAEAAQRAQASGRPLPATPTAGGTPSNFGDKGPRKQKPRSPRRNKGKRR